LINGWVIKMKKGIVRQIPSGSIKIDKYSDERHKTPIEYFDKNTKQIETCEIYKVSGSYTSSLTHTTSSYSSVSQSKGYSIKRLKELRNENKGKYFRKEDEILLEKTITEKRFSFNNEYLIEVSTNHSSSNHKYLKIWKYYYDELEYDWKPTKQGIVIPIKDGKDLIKELYDILTHS